MKDQNHLLEKSYKFALRVVKLYRYLCEERKEFILSKQLVRSGTSVGSNVEEANGGCSEKDFLVKINIAYKEARETQYWLRLLGDSELLDRNDSDSILNDCAEILRLSGTIVKTMRNKLSNSQPIIPNP